MQSRKLREQEGQRIDNVISVTGSDTKIAKMPNTIRSRKPRKAGCAVCDFCFRDTEDDVKLGKLHKHGNLTAHYYCLLFASNLEQMGKSDKDGILGFMPKDIHAELKRGKRLRCRYCKKTGATIGCVCKKCTFSYHLPCGLENDVMCQFFGTFPTYCKQHRLSQKPIEWSAERDGKNAKCSICFEKVVPKVSYDTLYPLCCKNGWFHKSCVQRQALMSGYFFRCPLCNNQNLFNEEMEKFGIYVPEQDASWEQEPGAFDDMYRRHTYCDVPNCLCPHGRDHDEDTVGESIWELVRCQSCGSQGTHIGCSNLCQSDPEWSCSNCLPTVNKLLEATSKKVKRKAMNITNSSQRPTRRTRQLRRRAYSTCSSRSSSPDIERNISSLSPAVSSQDNQVNAEQNESLRVHPKGTQPIYPSPSASPSSIISVKKESSAVPSTPQSNTRQRHSSSSSSDSIIIIDDGDHIPSCSNFESLVNSTSCNQPETTPINLKRPASGPSSLYGQLEVIHPVKKVNTSQSPAKIHSTSSNTDWSSFANFSSTNVLPSTFSHSDLKCLKVDVSLTKIQSSSVYQLQSTSAGMPQKPPHEDSEGNREEHRAATAGSSDLFRKRLCKTPSKKAGVSYRESSGFSSDLENSDEEETVKATVSLNCRSDSPPTSSKNKISPKFSIKSPASFCAPADHSFSSHPHRKVYQQDTANPFACLPSQSRKPATTNLSYNFFSPIQVQNLSSTDSSDNEMPVLKPYTEQYDEHTPSSQEIITIDDSD